MCKLLGQLFGSGSGSKDNLADESSKDGMVLARGQSRRSVKKGGKKSGGGSSVRKEKGVVPVMTTTFSRQNGR